MTKYFVGIDNGSQSSKVVIFDQNGNAVASGRQPLRPNDTPRPGVVEHPDDDLWDSICVASKLAMADFGGDLGEIVGVGLCTIRFCRAMLKGDGTLASPVLSWMDERVSRPYVDDDPQVAYVTTSSGYITKRITGENRDVAANYQGMWPIDTDTWQWPPAGDNAYESCGYRREQLFDLVQPGELLGEVTPTAAASTGLPVGVPVYATSNDKAVEALGSGLREDSQVLLSLGTYIATMAVGEKNVKDASAFWTNFASEPHKYLYESEGIRRGMWTVSWFKDLMGLEVAQRAQESGVTPEEYLSEGASGVPAGSDGLIVALDWLAPTDQPWRKGAFVGFDGRQGEFHMFRSILEGIAMEMATKADRMQKELGRTFDSVIVSGGGSNSDLMMSIVADCFGVPAQRMSINNAASLGSAVCAAVGSGVYSSFDEAVEEMVKVERTFAFSPERHELYQELGQVQSQLADVLSPTTKKLYEICG